MRKGGMANKNDVPHGYAIPNHSLHSVTVLQPTWEDAVAFGRNPAEASKCWQSSYPRLKVRIDIVKVGNAALKSIGLEEKACFLFPSLQSARESVEFATSPARYNGKVVTPISPDQITIRCFRAQARFYVVVYPPDKLAAIWSSWRTAGVGVSTRFAEVNLEHLDKLTELSLEDHVDIDPNWDRSCHTVIQRRIVEHLSRSPLKIEQTQPSLDDVYLYPSGMAAIYKPHRYLCELRSGKTVLFGMAFLNTITLFEEYGEGSKFFGIGTDDEISSLESFLVEERKHGRRVQAIWAEYPTNPLVTTPDLIRLRALADEFDTLLVVDSTISSFANVDILHMTDFIVGSLTKSFSGYADVLAGGAILNPDSKRYHELKPLFDSHYESEVYIADIEALEKNSRDYLPRTIKLNTNAASIITYLDALTRDPHSCVSKVYYPTVNPSRAHYDRFLRPATPDFTPGYGCLFSVEFTNEACAREFYNTINLWKTPHLGAPWTLLFAYTVCSYASKLDWAAQYGLSPSLVRVSAGLEETDELIREFEIALRKADEVWNRRGVKGANGANGVHEANGVNGVK